MSSVNIGHQNEVNYYLYSKSQGEVLIPEPIGFISGNGNIYERDDKSKGFIKTRANKLKYYGRAYEFLVYQFATKGILEDVLQYREQRANTLDERYIKSPPIFLDIAGAKQDDDRRTVEVEAKNGGLYNLIENKMSDTVDIIDRNSIVGTDIGPLPTVNVFLDPREIFLRSEGNAEIGKEIAATVGGIFNPDGTNARTIPFTFFPNSDQQNLQSSFGDQLSAVNDTFASVSSDKIDNLTFLNVSSKKICTINGRIELTIVGASFGTCAMYSVFYDGAENVNFKERILLDTCNPNVIGDKLEFVFDDYQLILEKGESWAIGLLSITDNGIRYRIDYASLIITENSGENLVGSTIRAIKPIVLGNRILAKIIGKNSLLISSLLDEGGDFENRLITNGFFIRNFPDVINEGDDDERRIQFNTSMEEFLKHLEAMRPIAWWTEEVNGVEVMRIEERKFTFQSFTGIEYGETVDGNTVYIQADKVTRVNLKDNFYSKLVFGSEVGGSGYEEVFGLQSICGKAEFSTINITNDSEYNKLSPYAMADIDVELPRRLGYEFFPDLDSKYDDIINCIDCELIGDTYYPKKYQAYFSEVPTGIYRPLSAYNLKFTPVDFLKEHGFIINSGLYQHPNSFIYFSSSNCNSSFSSREIGKEVVKQDQPIKNSELEAPRFKPKKVEFNLLVSLELENKIIGTTKDGTQNRFGRVAVMTRDGLEYMILVKVDTNGAGKHTLIESYL